jgi:hypothetical protein
MASSTVSHGSAKMQHRRSRQLPSIQLCQSDLLAGAEVIACPVNHKPETKKTRST